MGAVPATSLSGTLARAPKTLRAPCGGFQGQGGGRAGISDGIAAGRAVLAPRADPLSKAEFSKGQSPQLVDPTIPTLARG